MSKTTTLSLTDEEVRDIHNQSASKYDRMLVDREELDKKLEHLPQIQHSNARWNFEIGQTRTIQRIREQTEECCQAILKSDLDDKERKAVEATTIMLNRGYYPKPDFLSEDQWLSVLMENSEKCEVSWGAFIKDQGPDLTHNEIVILSSILTHDDKGNMNDVTILKALSELQPTPKVTALLIANAYMVSGGGSYARNAIRKMSKEDLQAGFEYLVKDVRSFDMEATGGFNDLFC